MNIQEFKIQIILGNC